MKQFIGKHKVTVAVILAGIVGIPSLGAYNVLAQQQAEKQYQIVQAEQKQSVAKVETPQATAETQTVAPNEQTEPVVQPVEQPVVLSAQEYAEKYLDMTTFQAQECLDRIIATWPERFVPEVRERNIKALSVWAAVCSTGMSPNKTVESSLIYHYGANGEFFDSQLAKTRW